MTNNSSQEPQPRGIWSIHAEGITLEQFLTAHNYDLSGETDIVKGVESRKIGSHSYEVGCLKTSPPSIKVTYSPHNPDEFSDQLTFRNLLKRNNILFEESPPAVEAAKLARAYAKQLEAIAEELDPFIDTTR